MRHLIIAILIAAFAGCGPVTNETTFTIDSPAMHYRSHSFHADPQVRPEDRWGPHPELAGSRYAVAGRPPGRVIAAVGGVGRTPMALLTPNAKVVNETPYMIVEMMDGESPVLVTHGNRPELGLYPTGSRGGTDSAYYHTCLCGVNKLTGQCRVVMANTDASACIHRVNFTAWVTEEVDGFYVPVRKHATGCAWSLYNPARNDPDRNKVRIRESDIGAQCTE